MQDDVVGKAYDARLMRRLVGYLGAHKRAVAVAFVAILGSSLIELAQPWITQQAIDRYIVTGDPAGLARMALLLFLVILGAFAFEYLQTFVLQTVGQRIMHTIAEPRGVSHIITAGIRQVGRDSRERPSQGRVALRVHPVDNVV
jgi:ABC-type bacteriocin/lantibiotic exporter with double-glycine peptidase domain